MSYTQKDKVKRGAEGERLITASLKEQYIWNYKMFNAGYGTLFDKLMIVNGKPFALEIKTRTEPYIAYSSISANERNGLDDFMRKVGEGRAVIIGIWLTKDVKRAFWIPWKSVRWNIFSGERGSICMTDFDELDRYKSGWDFQWLGGVLN
jgi:hypothetical protein